MKIGKFFIAGLLMLAPSWAFFRNSKTVDFEGLH